jgi:RimJ/RimL family protein N-acetyltransferase
MKLLPDFELQGDEVLLRPLSINDIRALAAAVSESRGTYGFSPVPNGNAETRVYIERALQQQHAGHRMPFTIVWRDRVVGSTSFSDFEFWEWREDSPFRRTEGPDAVEVGYTWLAASAQRTRCNTEAKYLLFTHAFEVWKVHRVTLRTDERNERSRRAIQRVGGRFEGNRRADMPSMEGGIRNSAFFSILSAEWPEVRDRLQGFLREGV